MAYGASNSVGLRTGGGQLAAAVRAAGQGWSLARGADGQWRANLVPTPGICETTP